MIDPKMLTPEAGFMDGVVIEYQYHSWGKIENEVLTFHAFFVGIDEMAIVIRDWESDRGESDCSLIESIRPLTGPMAIWNFAPEWAEKCQIMPLSYDVKWVARNEEVKTIGTVTNRPFWAPKKT